MEKGDLKMKVRLKETRDSFIAIGTLTYQGKQVATMQDPLLKINVKQYKNDISTR